jgi:alpha-beta hydrolase superfamily lysophospholipase
MPEPKTAKRKLPSIVRWILWVLLVQFILINISSSIYAYRLTRFYDDPALRKASPSTNILKKTWKLFTGPKQPRGIITDHPVFAYETVEMKTSSGLKIEAWYSRTDSAAKGTVILFHGITNTKGNLLDEAYEFRYWGYNVMLVDFRGHGNSEGNSTTIGTSEAEEVKLAMEHIAVRGEKNIFLFGVSLGAVAVARAVGEYGLKPAGVILEMPFLSLQTYLKGRARMLGFPAQPFAMLTTFWIGVERGYNGYRHKTTRYAKKLDCPVMMQCGALDKFVLMEESQKVYNAIASTDKKLVVHEKGQHESFLRHDQQRWRMETEHFLNAHLK